MSVAEFSFPFYPAPFTEYSESKVQEFEVGHGTAAREHFTYRELAEIECLPSWARAALAMSLA